MSTLTTERRDTILLVTIDRPQVRNAIDAPTAAALTHTFRAFDDDDTLTVAVLTGAQGTFCAGADLSAIAHNTRVPQVTAEGDAPPGRLAHAPEQACDRCCGGLCRRRRAGNRPLV